MQDAMMKSFKTRMTDGKSVDFGAPVQDFQDFLNIHFGSKEDLEKKVFAATRG